MRDVHLEEKLKVTVPLLGIGSRQTINQVEVDVLKARFFSQRDTLQGMTRIMAATEIFQVAVKKTLDADAQTIDA